MGILSVLRSRWEYVHRCSMQMWFMCAMFCRVTLWCHQSSLVYFSGSLHRRVFGGREIRASSRWRVADSVSERDRHERLGRHSGRRQPRQSLPHRCAAAQRRRDCAARVSVHEGEPLLWSAHDLRGLHRYAVQEQPTRTCLRHHLCLLITIHCVPACFHAFILLLHCWPVRQFSDWNYAFIFYITCMSHVLWRRHFVFFFLIFSTVGLLAGYWYCCCWHVHDCYSLRLNYAGLSLRFSGICHLPLNMSSQEFLHLHLTLYDKIIRVKI